MRPVLLALPLALALLAAGCSQPAPSSTTPVVTSERAVGAYEKLGFDGSTWPRLNGTTLTVLDHGAFGAFEEAKKLFEDQTGATVVHVSADDAGGVLNRAAREKGSPTFDIIYGIDNILWARAVEADIFEPYEPLLSKDIDPAYTFFDGTWHATPVDHGYIGVNWDPRDPTLAASPIADLDDVRDHGSLFATPDPRTSTPGLGFLLATIATYPEGAAYDWKDYWNDLFAKGVLVTSGWTEAYEQHFSAGYGVGYGGAGDRAIVTSYTESPAYEAFFGRNASDLARPLVAPNSTFHQVQTMGIAKGTKQLAAAQAWIEFSLTEEFQGLAASGNAVYPVVKGVDVSETYGGLDPAPGSFAPASFDAATLGRNVERWVREWVALCEAADCA